MLPSRGAIRSLSTARTSLKSQSLPNTTRFLDGHGRRFGTSTRLVGATWTGQSGMRPGALRSTAGAALLAGSIPARRAISFNFWSRPKPEADAAAAAAAAVPEAPAETIKTETLAPEGAAPAASPPPFEAAAPPPTSVSTLDSLSLNIEPTTLDVWQQGNISDIPEQIGYLKTLGLDFGIGPSSMVQWLLEHVYIYTGLPWWAAIIATTAIIRLVLIRPSFIAHEGSAKMQELSAQPEYTALKEKMTSSMAVKDMTGMQEARLAIKTIHERNNVKPLASFWGLLQIPFGYGTFVVLRGMAGIPVPSFETGGLLWFTDLAIPDPFYILPILGPIGILAMLRTQMTTAPAQTRAQLKLMAYILVPLTTAISIWLPAGIQFYFIVSTVLAMAQTFLFRNTAIRSMIGVPPIKPPPPAPETVAPASTGVYEPPTPSANTNGTLTYRAAEEPKKSTVSSAIDDIKQTIHKAKGGMGNYVDTKQKELADKEIKAWEERRAEEDRQKILAELRKKKANKNN